MSYSKVRFNGFYTGSLKGSFKESASDLLRDSAQGLCDKVAVRNGLWCLAGTARLQFLVLVIIQASILGGSWVGLGGACKIEKLSRDNI